MKYLFLAIAFFSLGYLIPSFPPVLQFIAAGLTFLLIAFVLYFYVDTIDYAPIA